MARKKGFKHSKETKEKMKVNALGREGWNKGLTKETDERVKKNAENISKALIGHIHSKQTIEKIRKKAIGRKHSKESKRKISEGVKRNPKIMRTKFKKGHIQSGEINKKKGLLGRKNPSWIDGRSYEKHYLPEFRKRRPEIIERDKGRCVLCNQKSVIVHHIDYNKKNNKKNNLVVLCHYHHLKTNFNRESWTKILRQLRMEAK